jgi:hypothetical protein
VNNVESLKKYSDYCSSFNDRKAELEAEREKHARHLALFSAELETAQLLNDKPRIATANKGVAMVTEQLAKVNNDLESMNTKPLAHAVLLESEEVLTQLNQVVEQQWQRAREKRIEFLRELEELGKLRRQSQHISWATRSAMLDLRRNPLEEIRYGTNRFEFLVEQGTIDKYLR